MDWLKKQLKVLATDDGSLVFGLTFFFVVLSSVSIGFLDKEVGLSLLTFLGIILAVLKYFYEKGKDRKTEIIDLISFFRKELLAEGVELDSYFKSSGAVPVRMKLDETDLDSAKKKYHKEALQQFKCLTQGEGTFERMVPFSNLLEEFSARVLTLSAEREDSLRILHDSFIKICETVSTFLLHDRKQSGDLNFKNTIELYSVWKRF